MLRQSLRSCGAPSWHPDKRFYDKNVTGLRKQALCKYYVCPYKGYTLPIKSNFMNLSGSFPWQSDLLQHIELFLFSRISGTDPADNWKLHA